MKFNGLLHKDYLSLKPVFSGEFSIKFNVNILNTTGNYSTLFASGGGFFSARTIGYLSTFNLFGVGTFDFASLIVTIGVDHEIIMVRDANNDIYCYLDGVKSTEFIHYVDDFTIDKFFQGVNPIFVIDADVYDIEIQNQGVIETFDLTDNSGKALEVVGSQGTIGTVETNNLNGIHYVNQFMRGNDGVEGGLKFDTTTNDIGLLDIGFHITSSTIGFIEFNIITQDVPLNKGNTLIKDSTDGESVLGLYFRSGGLEIALQHLSQTIVLPTPITSKPHTIIRVMFVGDGSWYIIQDGVMSNSSTYSTDFTLNKLSDTFGAHTGNGYTLLALNINSTVFDFNDVSGNKIESSSSDFITLDTSHTDGQLYIDNQIHRAISSGNAAVNKLTADVTFDNGADAVSLVEDVDYTDSNNEYYYINEGEGDTIYGAYGSRGALVNEQWQRSYLAAEKRTMLQNKNSEDDAETFILQELSFDSDNLNYR